jgi:hypothetical protein
MQTEGTRHMAHETKGGRAEGALMRPAWAGCQGAEASRDGGPRAERDGPEGESGPLASDASTVQAGITTVLCPQGRDRAALRPGHRPQARRGQHKVQQDSRTGVLCRQSGPTVAMLVVQ